MRAALLLLGFVAARASNAHLLAEAEDQHRNLLRCVPCNMKDPSEQVKPTAASLDCAPGVDVVEGMCPCSWRCAKQEGEKCGGIWNMSGTCQAPLVCVAEDKVSNPSMPDGVGWEAPR